jgi:hypothetical protein
MAPVILFPLILSAISLKKPVLILKKEAFHFDRLNDRMVAELVEA